MPSSDWPITASINSAGERNLRAALDQLADLVDRLQRLLASPDQHRLVEREAEMGEAARLGEVVPEVGQIAVEEVILEIDMAAVAGGEKRLPHQRRQRLLGADLLARAHVGDLVAAPRPARLGRNLGAQAVGGEMVDEEQTVLVRQVGREVGAFVGGSDVHGGFAGS
ncbi:hypothetical protein [Mesorhizobium sp.]|uniref:hypothetical protein n=1 Tax=Mesorhizobium sp. TaxID=1871066 RepID=UPI0025B7DDB5|nr:hypothetical protein [Mesorhizobium sp.]